MCVELCDGDIGRAAASTGERPRAEGRGGQRSPEGPTARETLCVAIEKHGPCAYRWVGGWAVTSCEYVLYVPEGSKRMVAKTPVILNGGLGEFFLHDQRQEHLNFHP